MSKKKRTTTTREERIVAKLSAIQGMRYPPGWTGEDVLRILCNPVYAGIHPYPPIVAREVWIRASKIAIKEIGIDAFFTIMLEELDASMSVSEVTGEEEEQTE